MRGRVELDAQSRELDSTVVFAGPSLRLVWPRLYWLIRWGKFAWPVLFFLTDFARTDSQEVVLSLNLLSVSGDACVAGKTKQARRAELHFSSITLPIC